MRRLSQSALVASSRSIRCARLARPLQRRPSVDPCGDDLEHQRAVVADLLHRQSAPPAQSIVPSNGTQMIVGAAAVVVHVRRDQVLRHGFDRVDDVAVQVRVAEVEADADVGRVEIAARRSARATPARDSSFGITSTATRTPSGSAIRSSSSTLRRAAVAAVVARRLAAASAARPRCTTSTCTGMPPRDVQRALGLADRLRARVADRRWPATATPPQRPPAKLSAIGAWTLRSSSPASASHSCRSAIAAGL